MEEIDKEQKKIQDSTLVIALITNFITPFAGTALNIAVPHIGMEFGMSATSLTWIVLAFLLVSAVLSVPFGKLSDIHGRRPLLKLGVFLFGIASIVIIFSPNMELFILCRVIQGVGGAMIYSTNVALLMDVFPAAKRGSVLGISVAAVYMGSALGPVIGGVITYNLGWRAVFVAISALSFVAFIIAMVWSPKEKEKMPDAGGNKIKFSSVFMFILSFGLFLFGVATLMQNIWSYFILAAGIVLVILYVKYESKRESPLFEIRLFKGNRVFTLSLLAALFNYAAIYAIAYLMSLYLQLGRGFAADISGLILIFQPVVQAALSPVAGRLSDKKPPSNIASLGMACCAAALAMFVFLDESTPMAYIIGGLLLTGFGIAFFSSPNSNVILSSVSNKDYGIASSLNSTARTFGQVIGMALLTIIIHITIGNVPIANVGADALIRDMRVSYIVFSAICVVGVLISLQRRKTKTAV